MENEQIVDEKLNFLQRHRFLVLVGAAIIISMILVVISMEVYSTSGAAQLDLSRPGYKGVSSQAVSNEDNVTNFSNSGSIDPSTIDQFQSELNTQAKETDAIDAFGGDPLNPDSLQISAPAAQ